MPILIAAIGIILLILMISLLKLDPFISFIVVSLFVGVTEGMPLSNVVTSIENGIGSTLGSLVMVLGFGAMLGKLVAESGAAQRITAGMISLMGQKYIRMAMVVTGFIVGIPMFYNVGFVILVPLVFTVAASTGMPLLYVGIPMLAALSVTHGFLPPHPSPTAIAAMFEADLGKTLLYGILIAIPVILVAGPLFSRTLGRLRASPFKEFVSQRTLGEDELPPLATSLLSALLPVMLIITSTLLNLILPEGSVSREVSSFLGNPAIALLISVLVAAWLLGLSRGRRMKDIMESTGKSVASIAMILLIIAGAGTLKQVLVDSKVSDYIAGLLQQTSVSPLILAWLIAAVIRVCVGSATVAGLTAAGIVLPLLSAAGVNRELMVLSIGAGSLILSHVNDTGFWLFKEYFCLDIRSTFLSWTIMESLIGVMGLAGVLVLDLIAK